MVMVVVVVVLACWVEGVYSNGTCVKSSSTGQMFGLC